MTQPDDHTTHEFTNYPQMISDLGGEPIYLGRDHKGHAIALDPWQEPVVVTGTRTGKTQPHPDVAGGPR